MANLEALREQSCLHQKQGVVLCKIVQRKRMVRVPSSQFLHGYDRMSGKSFSQTVRNGEKIMARMQNDAISRQSRPVPTRLLLWLSCGTIGSILFALLYLIEGATRPGYSAWQQAISALSLGPGGWVQQVNFVVFGTIIILTAFAWRRFLKGSVGATWYPILRVFEGLGLVVDGFFSQDPAFGYPKGAALVVTLHGTIHLIFAFVSITAIAFGFFVIARRFAKEPGWRGWATCSVITGILTIVLIATFGALNGMHSEIAGLFERLATGLGTLWGLIFFARLWTGTGFGSFQNQVSSPQSGKIPWDFLLTGGDAKKPQEA
jgi:hypothetical protein